MRVRGLVQLLHEFPIVLTHYVLFVVAVFDQVFHLLFQVVEVDGVLVYVL